MDTDGSGYIEVTELGDALEVCGLRLPGYQIRDLIAEFDNKIKDDKLDLDEFQAVGDCVCQGTTGCYKCVYVCVCVD